MHPKPGPPKGNPLPEEICLCLAPSFRPPKFGLMVVSLSKVPLRTLTYLLEAEGNRESEKGNAPNATARYEGQPEQTRSLKRL